LADLLSEEEEELDMGIWSDYATGMAPALDEQICIARMLYSETHLRGDMLPLAWVARNRMTQQYRGRTYCEVILWEAQFSGLTPGNPHYERNTVVVEQWMNWLKAPEGSLEHIRGERFSYALKVGRHVMYAPKEENPVPGALWFWAPVGMSGTPGWARGVKARWGIHEPGTRKWRWLLYDRINGESSPGALRVTTTSLLEADSVLDR
jgi:hypothetical protein